MSCLSYPSIKRAFAWGLCPAAMRWSYAILLALFVLFSFLVHIQAGLTLPNPWNDEPWNLWPAKALVETGSFVAPELNPDRPTMLYGGGYAATVGLFMRITSFSLESARLFSWLCMTVAFLATALMLWQLPWSHFLLGLVAWVYLSSAHVVAANTARPEALVLLIVSVGYLFLIKNHPIKAVFMCGLGVIVHPNALYFLVGTLLYTALTPSLWRRIWPPSSGDWAVMAACSIPVLLSALSIWQIWDHWFGFFQVQLAHNSTYNPVEKLIKFKWWLTLTGTWFAVGLLLRQRAAVWSLYGLASLLVALMGGEMWYDVYKVSGFMAMWTAGIAILVQIGRDANRIQYNQVWLRLLPAIVYGGVIAYFLAMGHFHYYNGFTSGPRNYPQKLSWGWGMTMADPAVPYLTDADRQNVASLAMDRAGSHPNPVIEFPATGDSFLFIDALPPHARPLLRIGASQEAQVVVFHLSRYIPSWVQNVILSKMKAYNINASSPDYERDQTEKWYVRPTTSSPRIASDSSQ